MIIITVIVIFVGIGGYIIIANPKLKAKTKEALKLSSKTTETNNVNLNETLKYTDSKITDRALPWVELKPESENFEIGKESTLNIYGSSNGKDITGYDMLIGIDKEYFDIVSIESQIEGFSIFHFDRDLYQSITGIKAPQDKKETPFSDTKMIKIVVKPKKKGETLITIIASNDKEKTQMVDADVQVVTPQIGSYLAVVK